MKRGITPVCDLGHSILNPVPLQWLYPAMDRFNLFGSACFLRGAKATHAGALIIKGTSCV